MIKCDTCGLWHSNNHQAHIVKEPPTVGPLSDKTLPEFWSWIYFHGKAEDHCMKYQEELIHAGALPDWEAPDLVRASIPIEQIEDGRFIRVNFVDGLEMMAVIWSSDPEYKQDYKTGVFNFQARRRGLICLYDDEEATEYAWKCATEKRDHL